MKHVEGFLKDFSPEDKIEENISNNYKYHLGRVFVSHLLSKETYNDKDLLTINVEELKTESVAEALNILKNISLILPESKF
jgi:hypothetical protein